MSSEPAGQEDAYRVALSPQAARFEASLAHIWQRIVCELARDGIRLLPSGAVATGDLEPGQSRKVSISSSFVAIRLRSCLGAARIELLRNKTSQGQVLRFVCVFVCL